jgi:hypothetical protein
MIPSPIPITPVLKSFGREQKYILKQMAKENHVIRVVMYHQVKRRDHIHLFDESGQKMRQVVFPELLQAMGRKGLFEQQMELNGMNISIVKFRLKEEVRNHFIN